MYLLKHNKPTLFGGNFPKILVILLLIFIFIFVFGFFGSARSLVVNLFSPFLKTGNYFYSSIGQVPKYFSDKNKLVEENNKLSAEIENNYLNLINLESLKYENQKLREELKIKPAQDSIAAAIIAKQLQIPLDTLFLDKGTSDGIKEGDMVLAGEKILIGKIVKASKNRSTVALDSFAGATTYGFVDRTDEPLEIKGVGGGGISSKVAIDFDIAIGDKIMVGGSSTSLAAVVGAIEEDKSSGFKNVLLSLPVNVSKINMVFVVPTINE
jgi:cell shape-determining protein MreC